MASVYAERFRQNPNMLRAAVMGQSPDPKLDSYTALNALRLIKEADMMAMSAQAQRPTSSPSILAETLAPPAPPQGMAGMMPMGAPAGQMPQQRAPMPQAPVMQASGGLAGMPISEENYAAGGIVAFNGDDESLVSDEPTSFLATVPRGTPYSDEETGDYPEIADGGGNTGLQALAFKNYQTSRKAIEDLDDGSTTLEEDRAARKDYLDFLKANAGPDIYKSAIDKLTEREGARGKSKSQGEGLALLAAAGAILEGNTLARGAAKAFPVFAKEMGEVQRADIAEQRSIEAMRFALDDAKRKERMGDVRGAQAAAETARRLKSDATRFSLNKANALATLDAKALQATRTNAKGAGAGAEPKLAEQLGKAEIAFEQNPSKENKAIVTALRRAVSQTKTSFSTGEIGGLRAEMAELPVRSKENIEANKALDRYKLMNGREWKKAVEAAGGVDAAEKQFKQKWITNNPQSTEAAPARSTAAPAAAPKPTATSKVASMADVDATVKSSGRTRQEVMDALKAQGYTIK